MKLSDVTNDDGRACAQLLAFLKAGSWQLKGSDVDELMRVRVWVGQLAQQMASQLKAPTVVQAETPAASPPSSDGAFKIKAMGPLGQSGKPRRQRK